MVDFNIVGVVRHPLYQFKTIATQKVNGSTYLLMTDPNESKFVFLREGEDHWLSIKKDSLLNMALSEIISDLEDIYAGD